MNVPFYLAPMAEISHRAFRELIEEFGGCDGYFSEMISAPALLAGGPFEKWYIDNAPNPEKLVFQLVGADPLVISEAAALLAKLECAGIDINMGCSAPLIRKTGAGAAWMASVDRAGELISRVRPKIKRRLSVKLRIGFKDDFDYLVKFCRRLEGEGVEMITLHPRTVTEKFKRLARWDYVGALRRELKIPITGNGDIANAKELLRRANGPCDAVMVGRAAVQMPWIFAEARSEEEAITDTFSPCPQGEANPETFSLCPQEAAPRAPQKLCKESAPEPSLPSVARSPAQGTAKNVFAARAAPPLEEIGIRFLELLALYQPVEFHVSRAKRFFGFFCDNLKWGTYLKNKLNQEDSLAGIEQVWLEYFKENDS